MSLQAQSARCRRHTADTAVSRLHEPARAAVLGDATGAEVEAVYGRLVETTFEVEDQVE